MRTLNWKQLAWWACGLALLAALTAPELAAAERTVGALVQEPFEVNDRLFDAGAVKIRELKSYNPTTTMTEIWVEGHCLGVMLADVSMTPNHENDDSLIFKRNAAGHLVLVGFAYRNQPSRELYGFVEAATGRRWSAPAERSVESFAKMIP